VVTGHRETAGPDERPGAAGINWEALAQVGGTVVVLMGVAERAVIARRLMAGGLPGTTPVAAVRWGTRPDQQVIRTTLADLGDAAVQAPATIVIGAVAGLELLSHDVATVVRSNSGIAAAGEHD
jgi:siroheme synthase